MILGGKDPLALNITLFFLISQHFGTRGCQEHHQLRLEDLRIVKNPSNGRTEYVERVEGPTKTRPGGLIKARRLIQRMFATHEKNCLVQFLELLISKRPAELRDSGPLYRRPLKQPKQDEWYSIQPIGVNKIDKFMKMIAQQGELDDTNKNFTKYSVRKTTVTKLQKVGVPNYRDYGAQE